MPSVVSDYPSISGDGRYVAFRSNAFNITATDTSGDPADLPKVIEETETPEGQSGSKLLAEVVSPLVYEASRELMAALDQMESSLERATANIPDPTYPRR